MTFDDLFEADPQVVIRPLSQYATEVPDYLWPNRIPRAEVTMIAGDGGLGKSTLAAELGARVSTGELSGTNGTRAVHVLLGEDHPGRVLQARFRAAGADMSRVGVIAVTTRPPEDGPIADDLLSLPRDLPKLAEKIIRNKTDLLIIDPITAFLGGDVDTHRDGGKGGMRAVLGPLGRLAHDHGTTILVLAHLNKGTGPAEQRIAGAVGQRNAVRNLLFLAPHPEASDGGRDDGRRVLGHNKTNGDVMAPSIDVDIVGVPMVDSEGNPLLREDGTPATVSRAVIGSESTVDYRTALAVASAGPATGDAANALAEAREFLRDELADGPKPVSEVEAGAAAHGITTITLKRARKGLRITSTKQGSKWIMSLPTDDEPLGENREGSASTGVVGHANSADAAKGINGLTPPEMIPLTIASTSPGER